MRFYGGRLLKANIEKRISQHIESRDAEVYDINYQTRTARVKIQGTTTLVKAYFPENMEQTPSWLKPGNAVRISHTGGDRGRIELVGHGSLIITPIEGDIGIPASTTNDTVVSGLNLFPDGGMVVSVSAGQVRFSDVIGSVQATTKTITTAPSSGNYRYDLIVVGSDLVVDLVTGTASSNPTKPAIPDNHILVGWVFIYPGKTEITARDINSTYSVPIPTSLSMVIADTDLIWSETSTTVSVTAKDQYNNNIDTSGDITLLIASGDGEVSIGGSSSTTSVSSPNTGAAVVFTYTRNQLSTDSSPILRATLGGSNIPTSGIITLHSENDSGYVLPIASDAVLGGIKVGANLSIDENGILSAQAGGGSGGSGIGLSLVAEHIVSGSAESSITFSGLSGLSDGGYTLELALIGVQASSAIGLEINGDSTATNYKGRRLEGGSGVTSIVQTPTTGIIEINSNGSLATSKVDIQIANGLVNFISEYTELYSSTHNVNLVGTRYTPTVSDITSLVLQGYTDGTNNTLSGCFGVGTVARLYRKIISNNNGLSVKTATALVDTAVTLTAAQILGGVLTAVPTADRNQTLPLATNIIAAMPSSLAGTSFDFILVNTAAYNETLITNTGVTLVGNMVVNNSSATFRVLVTSSTTVSIFRC